MEEGMARRMVPAQMAFRNLGAGYEVKKGLTLEAESESGALNGGTTSLQVCGVAVDFVN